VNSNKSDYAVEMSSETRNFLRDYYKHHNKKLYSLLGENFSWK